MGCFQERIKEQQKKKQLGREQRKEAHGFEVEIRGGMELEDELPPSPRATQTRAARGRGAMLPRYLSDERQPEWEGTREHVRCYQRDKHINYSGKPPLMDSQRE